MRSHIKFAASAFAIFSVFSTFAQTGPEVTPYRPGAAANSVLSATGMFETEFGFDSARGGGVRAEGISALLKYGVSDSVGVIVGLPFLRVSGNGARESGLGDGLLGVKYIQKISSSTQGGFQLTTSLPTGKSAFRSDDPTLGLTGIYGIDFSGFHADLNVGVRHFTGETGGANATTFTWVAGLARPVGNGLGWYLEASGTRNSDAGNTTTAVAALTYTMSKQVAFDASYSRARAGGANANGFGIGMTYLFAR